MSNSGRAVQITSVLVILTGAGLLAVNILSGGEMNLALPLVFLVLGGGFFILLFRFRPQWAWAAYLGIPGSLLIAFGFIFLLNVITQDWNSWAYAWLLLVAALGVGLLLANGAPGWRPSFNLIGWGTALTGVTGFALFGAIARGSFIQIAAPIILVIAGLSLRWLRLETLLPGKGSELVSPTVTGAALVEELSSRELEVLRLIDAGYANQEIAGKLSVAPSTVKTHINNIYGKLGVKTRVQAVNRARELGVIE